MALRTIKVAALSAAISVMSAATIAAAELADPLSPHQPQCDG